MANGYAQLSVGVNNKDAVSQLQTLLNEKIGAGLQVDGIFGPKTEQAVRNYQRQKNLQVDGIVGPKTWAALLQSSESSPSGTTAFDRTAALKEAAAAAKEVYTEVQQKQEQKKEAEKFTFQEQKNLDEATKDYLEQPAFSYDLFADPLYQQSAARYLRAGRQAMEDTIGVAAALTGGYGNSYAQTAGQQVYGSYLQQMNDQIPELYALALGKYEKESERLRRRYEMLKAMENQAYNRHQDMLERSDKTQGQLILVQGR